MRARSNRLSLSRAHVHTRAPSHSLQFYFRRPSPLWTDFSLFSHRCLDLQLIIRDLPSAQRDWPLATSCTVMANSRLRNHARHTTPVPKYFLRKSVRLCTSRTSFERLFLFRFDRFFFDFFLYTVSRDSYIYIYMYMLGIAWYRFSRILYYTRSTWKRF